MVEVKPEIPEEPSPSNIMAVVLSELAPQDEVAEHETSGRRTS